MEFDPQMSQNRRMHSPYRVAASVLVLIVVPVLAQTPAAPVPGRQAIIDELVVANHILANEGVLDGYGHVSVRNPADPTRYFLARAGAPALVKAADITEYNLDSDAVTNTTNPAAAGYIERFIHGEIYKVRPDVMAIVHCHCSDLIPFGVTSVPMQPMYHMGYFIAEGVPVWDIRKAGGADMLVRNSQLGHSLAQTLGDKSAALMRGHGAAVAATSLHLVVGKAFYLNLNARLQMQAMQLGGGKVNYLSVEEAKSSAQDYERSWDAWKSRLPAK
jgi:ribulose-5-phosphate 4-epimerase/fuculose-1-phosphate aldolase